MQELQEILEQVIDEYLPSVAGNLAGENVNNVSLNKSYLCDLSQTRDKEVFNVSGHQSFDNRNNMSIASNDDLT